MNNIYLLMTALVAVTMTVGFAYAERSVVEIPFDYTGHSCTFDEFNVIYTCKWEGSSETIPSDKSEAGIVPPEQILEESKEAHDLAVDLREEIVLTPTERKILQLEEELADGSISTADRVLLKALKDMNDVCTLGIEHGRLIQEYAQFEIPMLAPDTLYQAINLDTNQSLKKILMKTMECEMWDEYRVSHLGQRYLDIEAVGTNNQAYHAEMVQSLETFPHDKLDNSDFKASIQQAKDLICENSLYHYSFKKQSGCFEGLDIAEGKGIAPTSEAYKNYLEYMSSGHVDLSTLKKQEVERAVQESLDSFAQRHGIDIADLKNLVQSVDEYNEAQKP